MPRLLLLLLLTLVSPLLAARPNFIVYLTDDLGATDLACYGSKFYETPNLDRLAREGVRFTQAYSACTVCSPTRAAMMTGQWPAVSRITDYIPGHERPFARLRIPEWQKELPHDQRTIATALRESGYATAHFGKWHLEHAATEFGFDVSVADNGKGQPASYLPPYRIPGFADGPPGEELTARLTVEAGRFIEANREKPFFVYFAPYAVHTPLGGKPEVIARYRQKADASAPQHNAAYAAMVQAVDDSVGALRAQLESLGLWENTVILFTSDNGGLRLQDVTYNLGLRSGKGDAYEGGVRVVGLCRWPGLSQAGLTCPTPVITLDWPTTLAAAAGVKLATQGVDVRPLLQGGTIAARPLFWHYPHYHPGGATPYSAVREGDWKLVHFYEDGRDELYDLAADPEEKQDRSSAQVDQAKRLRATLDRWLAETNAQQPTPNPDYDPNKASKPKPKS